MQNKSLIVANWKANHVELGPWLQKMLEFSLQLKEEANVEIAIAAPFSLVPVIDQFLKANIFENLKACVACQDVSSFGTGAYTGEEPAEQLKELGVKYCLIGHSERRKYFGETNETVGKKISQATQAGLIPIVCGQEWTEIPSEGQKLNPGNFMYEPFSAISTNGAYHPESPGHVHEVIAKWRSNLPPEARILYGGSVNSENVAGLLTTDYGLQKKVSAVDSRPSTVDGFVVGHASLDPEEFFSIIKKCLEHSPSHS